MKDIVTIIEALRSDGAGANQKSPLKDLGFISCATTVHIRHVPFYEPCLILVLSGRKVLFDGDTKVAGAAGSLLAVPGPSSFDLRNEPDAQTKRYSALIIPFKLDLLERLTRSHNLLHEVHQRSVGVLAFAPDDTLHASIAHYLGTEGNARLLSHRLMEILLVLATQKPALLSFALQRTDWSRRVRATVAADLAHPWDIGEVCARLATTESTLRRQLRREDTSFREVLYELRLATALTQLLQTPLPIYRIAYECGYQSVSRFTSNFHKRFGLPPKALRASLSGSEQTLAASSQSPQK
jgi:AraC-like DNA-binding protein